MKYNNLQNFLDRKENGEVTVRDPSAEQGNDTGADYYALPGCKRSKAVYYT